MSCQHQVRRSQGLLSRTKARRLVRAAVSNGFLAESLEGRRLLSHAATGDELNVPQLSSRPGAPMTIWIDFDGAAAFDWGSNHHAHGYGDYNAPIPAYNIDSNPASFSTSEITEMTQIWATVAEKYSPFDLNITTVPPPNEQLVDGVSGRIIVGGGPDDWYGSGGGVAMVSGFYDNHDNNGFVWPVQRGVIGGSSATRVHYVGDSIAHEAGHLFGLQHQRSTLGDGSVDEYYDGDNTIAPIMGGSSNNNTANGIWWHTNQVAAQNSPDGVIDEYDALTGVGVSGQRLAVRQDDYPDGFFGALTPDVNGTIGTKSGVIENRNDVDSFVFQPSSPRATFTVANAQYGGMLRPVLSITNSQGFLFPTAISSTNKSTVITADGLNPGQTYYLRVTGDGQFGNLGQYTVNGQYQQFATYNSATRTITLGGQSTSTGGTGNNVIDVSYYLQFGSNIPYILITDSVNGGTAGTQTFAWSAVSRINVNLGNGNDKLVVHNLTYNGGSPIVSVNLGGGTNTLSLDATDLVSNFVVDSNSALRIGSTPVYFSAVNRLEFHTGAGDTNIEIGSFDYIGALGSFAPSLYIYGNTYADRLTIDPPAAGAFTPHIQFDAGGGADSINAMTPLQPASRAHIIVDGEIDIGGYPDQQIIDYTSVEQVTVNGTSGDDLFSVYSLAATTSLVIRGAGGDDRFTSGEYPYTDTSGVLGPITFDGGTGTNLVTVDDSLNTGAHTYTITSGSVRRDSVGTLSLLGQISHITLFGSSGSNTYVVTGGTNPDETLAIVGGAGGNYYNFRGSNWNASVTGPASYDQLVVDDSASLTAPSSVELYEDRFVQNVAGTPRTVSFTGIESTIYDSSFGTHPIDVYGVATGTTAGLAINTAAGPNDSVIVHAIGDDGLPTIHNYLQLRDAGGADDTVTFDASNSTTQDLYRFYNNGAAGYLDLFGAIVNFNATFENLVIQGGSNNDTFQIDSFVTLSRVTLYGNDGDDTLEVTPTSKNVSGSITSIAGLNFDGGNGAHDAINVHDDNSSGNWNYGMNQDLLTSTKTGYTLNYAIPTVEDITVSGNGLAGTFRAIAIDAGDTVTFRGNGGTDTFLISTTQDTQQIAGNVWIDGGGQPADSFTIDDTADTVGRTLHVLQDNVGAVPGDDLFAGGSFHFANISGSSFIKLGSGVDHVFAQPNLITPITIAGNDANEGRKRAVKRSANGDDAGDTIGFALAGIDATVDDSSVTTADYKPLNFTGFEDVAVDDVAPQVIAADYVWDTPTPYIQFTFDEPMSAAFDGSMLNLYEPAISDTTDPSLTPAAYDAEANVVRFYYTGSASGALADGNYVATLLPGAIDAFGNAMTANDLNVLSFFSLAGDANHDGVVNFTDLVTLASHYNQSGQTFSGGNFDYSPDGVVNFTDLVILASRYNHTVEGLRPLPMTSATANAFVNRIRTDRGFASLDGDDAFDRLIGRKETKPSKAIATA